MMNLRAVHNATATFIVVLGWALPCHTAEPAPNAKSLRYCPMPASVRTLEVQDGVALVEAGNVLCAVEPATLKELWRTRLCQRGLYVDDQRPRHARIPGLVLVCRAGKSRGSTTELALEALDIRSGRPRWRYDVGPLRHIPPIHVAGGMALLMEGRGEEIAGNQHLACLDLATGSRRWHKPDVRSLGALRVAERHFRLGHGPEPKVYSLATGTLVPWANVPEAERTALQRRSYFCGKVRCVVTELWSDARECIVHVNAREWRSCKLYFGRDVILRIRHGQLVDPDKPNAAIWALRLGKDGSAARMVNAVSHGKNLIVLLNPTMSQQKLPDRAYCLNRETGKILWRFACAGLARPGVVLGNAFLFAEGKAIHALDVDSGRELWTHEMRADARHRLVTIGSVAVFGDQTGLIALDATGRVAWRRRLTGGLRADPITLGKNLLVASAELSLLDGATGRPVMPTREVPRAAVGAAPPVADEQAVYVLTRSGGVYAVDRKTFALRWRAETLLPAGGGLGNSGSLVLAGKVLYAASGRSLVALNRDNGTLLWRRRFERCVTGVACTGKQVIAIADKVYAFDLASGAAAWQFKHKYSFSRYNWYHSDMTPLIRNRRLYFTDRFSLYCLDAATGQKLWDTRVADRENDRIFSMPAQDDTRLVYTAQDGGLYAVDLASGQRTRIRQRAPCLGGQSAYGIVGDELYWPTTYLTLVRVLSAKDGAELAAIPLDDRALSPLVTVGKQFFLGGQRSLIVLDPRRRAVARTIATGHPSHHLLPTADSILVVDQGLKEYR